ncbi:hypothetical protein SACE_5075 [Saccharopolyspora erythraea NRRL 2338]|uniref:Uncharacterized protein n=1 Tax=Saccharopolyspora erythraea (strain ATCC 11635 / DSM 40517 / JCM 4748 / NBRC 13426 / NCIMB 8594 / NRRL 2338) TaxID=405948 RepID=A4FJV9_SACEN|nr:hypothetical protein SACE_5075 [Saccharopolyspora erythraea NRRL 2338]
MRVRGHCQSSANEPQSRRNQAACGNRAFHSTQGQQREHDHYGLRPQPVVVREPESQEHCGSGPPGRGATPNSLSQPGKHLATDQEPACEAHHQSRQAHPRRGGRDLHPPRVHIDEPAHRSHCNLEPAVEVTDVAQIGADARHGQEIAVISRHGANQPPDDQHTHHRDVSRCGFPPARGREPARTPCNT